MAKKSKIKQENKPIISGLERKPGKWILLTIQDANKKVVGQLDLVGKYVTFRGNPDKAARAFFDCTKSFIDSYIAERLTQRVPDEEEVIGFELDSSIFTKVIKQLGLKPDDVLAHTEYPNRIVIVTKAGKKHTVPI